MGVRDWLEVKKRDIEEVLYLPQKRAFLEWASGVLNAGDMVLVTVTGREEWCTAIHQKSRSSLSLRVHPSESKTKIKIQKYNVKFKIDLEGRNEENYAARLRLVMCLPGEFENVLKGLRKEKQKEEWQKIFGSSILEIWEWREYYTRHEEPLPLRFGFSREEKELMAHFVRKEAEEKLQGSLHSAEKKTAQAVFPERFRERVFLGAALWIRGELRSSVIIKDMPLDSALGQAASEVPFDPRFKPVGFEEFGQARLEITIVHEPYLPLSEREKKQDIHPTHGYRISWREKRGWYFPEVFNCTRFSNMPDMLTKLAEDKAGIPRSFLPQASKVAFEVTDFVEAKDRGRVLDLTGPIVKTGQSYGSYEREFREDLGKVLHAAAQYLARIQESDGNIPPDFNPFTGKAKQIDWIRQGLSAGSLIFAGQVLENATYREAGERALYYMARNFFSHPALSARTRSAASVYYAKTLLLVGRAEEAKRLGQNLLPQYERSQHPITDLQVASLFASLGEVSPEFLGAGKNLLLRVLEDYERRIRRKESLQLASFPEGIRVLLKLADVTGEKSFREKAHTLTAWHAGQQLSDGSFPIVPGSSFAYSRGTGKIFEVLALEPKENQKALLRVFVWLKAMQYTEENTYFIREDRRPQVLGGFRHDALNPETWTDATAHVLIGGARLLHFLKTGKESRAF